MVIKIAYSFDLTERKLTISQKLFYNEQRVNCVDELPVISFISPNITQQKASKDTFRSFKVAYI